MLDWKKQQRIRNTEKLNKIKIQLIKKINEIEKFLTRLIMNTEVANCSPEMKEEISLPTLEENKNKKECYEQLSVSKLKN